MTLTDEQFADTLRHRAAAAAPPMALDVEETLHLGVRHRRARRIRAVAGTIGSAAVVVVLAVAGVAALGGPRPPAAPAGRDAHPIGSAQVVELAPGIAASNSVDTTVASDGLTWWDTGLRFDYPIDGTPRTLSVGFTPLGDDSIQLLPDGTAVPGPDDGIVQGVDDPSGWALHHWGILALTWSPDAGPVLGGGSYQDPDSASSGTAVHLVTGAVPTWVEHPRVVLVFTAAAPAPDGSTTWVELPTFADPQDSGRLLFAAVVQPGAAWADARTQPHVYIVAGDGSGAVASDLCGTDRRPVCLPTNVEPGLAEAIMSVGGVLPAEG